MLLPPVIVSRPGDNGSPNGACRLNGTSLAADGPYALCHNGEFYSRSAAVELVRAFGDDLILTDAAQKRAARLVREVSQLRSLSDGLISKNQALASIRHQG